MTTRLEKALEKVAALPQAEQETIAAQFLHDLENEELWKQRLESGSPAQRTSEGRLAEQERGETNPLWRDAPRKCVSILR